MHAGANRNRARLQEAQDVWEWQVSGCVVLSTCAEQPLIMCPGERRQSVAA